MVAIFMYTIQCAILQTCTQYVIHGHQMACLPFRSYKIQSIPDPLMPLASQPSASRLGATFGTFGIPALVWFQNKHSIIQSKM